MDERPDLTVIAKKIASATQQGPDRPASDDIADKLMPRIEEMLGEWLELDELDIESVTSTWASPERLELPSVIISRQGIMKSNRVVIALTPVLAESAVSQILRIPIDKDPNTQSMLTAFVNETVMGLAEPLDLLPVISLIGDSKNPWALETLENVKPLLGEAELLHMRIDLLTSEGDPAEFHLVITPALLKAYEGMIEEENEADKANEPGPPPRLGPCHVNVRAVADRVRMSVADCSRLEIGQVIALPGLRFDHLELNIEMGEGPVLLTDASLGADKGQKAVRLNRGLDPDFRVSPPDLRPHGQSVAPPLQTEDA